MVITTCHRGLVGSVIESQMTSSSGGSINMIIVSWKKCITHLFLPLQISDHSLYELQCILTIFLFALMIENVNADTPLLCFLRTRAKHPLCPKVEGKKGKIYDPKHEFLPKYSSSWNTNISNIMSIFLLLFSRRTQFTLILVEKILVLYPT